VVNPFQQFGQSVVSSARAKRKAAKPEVVPKTALEKKEADQERLFDLWLVQFNKQKKGLLEGPYAGSAAALCSVLENLTLEDGDMLIEVARGWQGADRKTRELVLHLISIAMMELRCRHDLPPFDDPIFGQDDNAFLIIRKLLTGV
jgi:hypothetical protein